MVAISQFSSVLEIAFAMNALFYLFEAAPFAESKMERQLQQFMALRERKIAVTKNHEAFPIVFVLRSLYPITKQRLSWLSVVTSAAVLGLLTYAGFQPNAALPGWLMLIILLLSLTLVPFWTYISYQRYSRLIAKATASLQTMIDEG